MPTNQDILNALKRYEVRLEAVETRLTELHASVSILHQGYMRRNEQIDKLVKVIAELSR